MESDTNVKINLTNQEISVLVKQAWVKGISTGEASSILSSLLERFPLNNTGEFKKLQSRDATFFRKIFHLLTYFVFCHQNNLVSEHLTCLYVDSKNKNKVIDKMKKFFESLHVKKENKKVYSKIINDVYIGSKNQIESLGRSSEFIFDFAKTKLVDSLDGGFKQRIGQGVFKRENYGDKQRQPGLMQEYIDILKLLKCGVFIHINSRK